MKGYTEIILITLLIVLMFVKSQNLNIFAKSVLGKITLVITVIFITAQFGRNAGVIAAAIFVLLLHTSYEGAKSKSKPAPKPAKETEKKKEEAEKKGSEKYEAEEAKKSESKEVQDVKQVRKKIYKPYRAKAGRPRKNRPGIGGVGPGVGPTGGINIQPGRAMTEEFQSSFANITDLDRENVLRSEYAKINASAE